MCFGNSPRSFTKIQSEVVLEKLLVWALQCCRRALYRRHPLDVPFDPGFNRSLYPSSVPSTRARVEEGRECGLCQHSGAAQTT